MIRLKTIFVAIATISIVLVSQGGHAHSGGLNSAGCHEQSSTGLTHCHNPFTVATPAKSSGGRIEYPLLLILGMSFGMRLIRKNDR